MKTTLKTGEKLILEIRPHWFTLVTPFLIMLLGLVLGGALAASSVGNVGLLIALPFIGYFVYKMVDRNNNIWAVTNLRVIDEYGIFSDNTKESQLEKINNVTYNQTFFGKIFGYGDVQIQTAAEVGATTYFMVQQPKELKDTITQMQEEYKGYHIKLQANELANAIFAGQQNHKTDVASVIEKLFDLKQRGILTEEEFQVQKAKALQS
jgi:uncharacterized membrane protein YdbT with pleckstrin-like domain